MTGSKPVRSPVPRDGRHSNRFELLFKRDAINSHTYSTITLISPPIQPAQTTTTRRRNTRAWRRKGETRTAPHRRRDVRSRRSRPAPIGGPWTRRARQADEWLAREWTASRHLANGRAQSRRLRDDRLARLHLCGLPSGLTPTLRADSSSTLSNLDYNRPARTSLWLDSPPRS
jgi:hypothetical protein